MSSPWLLDTLAGALVAVSFVAIGLAFLAQMLHEHRWTSGMAVAAALIFVVVGVRSGLNTVALVRPGPQTVALRAAVGGWATALDVVAALAGLYYWTLRSGFRDYVRGARLFNDLRDRQQEAMEIHDNVVQGLAVAQMALDLGEEERLRAALDQTMAAARDIISRRLGSSGVTTVDDGDLRRRSAASGRAPA